MAASADGPAIRLRLADDRIVPGALDRENYTIRTSESGIALTGATPLAVQHAVWDLLHRIGYRQYFPGPEWEISPRLDSLTLELDVTESPDYASRRIWYGYGLWDHNGDDYRDWVAKNRMEGGFSLNTGHAYGKLIRSRQADFDAHPEYYALVDGKRHIHPEAKLCIAQSGVCEAAIAYALEFFAQNPDEDSVSMDPSDGGHWCECEPCARIGPPNNRATLLANTVAEAVTAKLGKGRYVGMYAYNYHSEPPSLTVHPNVIISAATGFIKGGLNIDQIITGWAARGATIGIREYYSVNTWDRDLPGAARGGHLDYLADTIADFHARGARFLSAESNDNWGPNGLGYYFASRAMWDVGEAARREAIVDDFLERAFGPAREPMGEFYRRIDSGNRQATLVFDDLLARMFRSLEEARKLADGDPAIMKRIESLILWTRHAELYDRYRQGEGPGRQAAFEAMVRHAYRMRGTYMVHSLGLYRDVDNRDDAVTIPEAAHWTVPEPRNPWKSSEPFTATEIEAILGSGLANHTPVNLDFAPVAIDDTALRAARDHIPLPDLPSGSAESGRGTRSWLTVVENAPARLELRVTGGLIVHYRDRGPVKIRLWKLGGASATGEGETLVAEDASVPPDGVERPVVLVAAEPGVYRIDLDDGRDLTRVTWPEGQIMSWKMSLEEYPNMMSGRWTLYAWVPEGTRTIGLYSAADKGELLRPDGTKALDLAAPGGKFLSAPVPEGADGQFWKFHSVAGRISLISIPPYLARHPGELVTPKP
ncbi:MAG: DUF4838 domain-containing protein [Verrucomicrobiales bacterium]|nr:DUF4838 domain-containing protein [Verrucomicrobiales bacterium]